MILRVAGVSGVYKIFPMSRGFSALQIIREMGLDSRFFIMLLQYGAEGAAEEQIKRSCTLKLTTLGMLQVYIQQKAVYLVLGHTSSYLKAKQMCS